MFAVTKTDNDHKPSQTATNHQQTTANNHKRLQTTNKRLQTTNKRTLTTSKRLQTATSAHQTKNFTFFIFFPHPVITRNTPILKNITLRVPNKSEGVRFLNSCMGDWQRCQVLISTGVLVKGRGSTKIY